MMPFELVEKAERIIVKEPKLIIRPNGIVSLNKMAMKMVKGNFVEVYCDTAAGKVGFKFMARETPNTLKMGRQGFSAKSRLTNVMQLKQSMRYDVTEEEGMLVINLAKGETVKSKKQNKDFNFETIGKEDAKFHTS